jgi:hypothetical protein
MTIPPSFSLAIILLPKQDEIFPFAAAALRCVDEAIA